MNKLRQGLLGAIAASFILCICLRPAGASDSDMAVLVMAHGGSSRWNKTVKTAVKKADLPCPYKIFFGLGDNASELKDLQDDVRSLEDDGAHTIVVVPLLESSYSEVARQWKYLLGVSVQPGFINNPLFPVDKHSTIQFMEPLNDSAVVVEILLDRAQAISEQASKESVIIVAHGPHDDSDNARWNQILQTIAARVKERGGFKSVEGFNLRDDASSVARSDALDGLRQRIQNIEASNGRVLVVSLALSPGGIENKLGLELRGLSYAFNTKVLLPDSRISEWIRSQVP